jgi:Flp pilus assembly pilin Flp
MNKLQVYKCQALERLVALSQKLSNKLKAGLRDYVKKEDGTTTAEYAIVIVAAIGLAGVLLALLKSDFIKEMLQNTIGNAFSNTTGTE